MSYFEENEIYGRTLIKHGLNTTQKLLILQYDYDKRPVEVPKDT